MIPAAASFAPTSRAVASKGQFFDQIIVRWRHRVAKTALNREAELVALAEAEAEARFPGSFVLVSHKKRRSPSLGDSLCAGDRGGALVCSAVFRIMTAFFATIYR
jgi:hypothetical protein